MLLNNTKFKFKFKKWKIFSKFENWKKKLISSKCLNFALHCFKKYIFIEFAVQNTYLKNFYWNNINNEKNILKVFRRLNYTNNIIFGKLFLNLFTNILRSVFQILNSCWGFRVACQITIWNSDYENRNRVHFLNSHWLCLSRHIYPNDIKRSSTINGLSKRYDDETLNINLCYLKFVIPSRLSWNIALLHELVKWNGMSQLSWFRILR